MITNIRWSSPIRTKHYETNDSKVNELVDGGIITAAGYGEGPNYTQIYERKLEVLINGVWKTITYTRKTE